MAWRLSWSFVPFSFICLYQVRKILSAALELRINQKLRLTASRTGRQLSEKKKEWRPLSKEGRAVVRQGRKCVCDRGDNMRISFATFAPEKLIIYH